MASFDFSSTCDAFSGSAYEDISQVDYMWSKGWAKEVDFTQTRPIRKSSLVDRGSFSRLFSWQPESSQFNGVHSEFSDNFKPGIPAYTGFPLKDLSLWFKNQDNTYSTTWWTAIALSTSYDRIFNGVVDQALSQKMVVPRASGKSKDDLSLYLDVGAASLMRSITGFSSALRSLTGLTDSTSKPFPYGTTAPAASESSEKNPANVQTSPNKHLLNSVVSTLGLHIGHDNLKAEKPIDFAKSYELLLYISSRLNIKECDECMTILKHAADEHLMVNKDSDLYQKRIDLYSLFFCHASLVEKMVLLQRTYKDYNANKCKASEAANASAKALVNRLVRDIFNYHRLISLNLIFILSFAIVLDYLMVKRNASYKSYFSSTSPQAKYLQETINELSVMTRRLAAAYVDLATSQADISLSTEESNAVALDIQVEAQLKVLTYINVSLVRVVQPFVRVASAGVYNELNNLL